MTDETSTVLIERISTALAGRYEVTSELGRGGMAVVLLARDLRHDRHVALKVFRPDIATSVGPERFLREIKTAAALEHPHILTLIDSGMADGLLYYVMPYIQGASLRERIVVEKQLGLEETVTIAGHVASALDYAHRHGVVHRDIKPENVLLHEGSALVADFGISLATGVDGSARLTETGFALGTPQYMSPEQAAGDRELDARADTYALGCLVYEMLTGEPPHSGATPQSVFSKTMTEMPTPISVIRKNVPEHVEAAVERALAKVPADRFATTMGFAEALSSPNRPITGPSSRTARRARVGGQAPPLWRRSSMLGWAFVIVVLAVVWSTFFNERTTRANVAVSTRQITFSGDASSVALAPDGEMVAYLGDERRTIFLKDIDGEVELALVEADEPLGSPRWNSDGSTILFAGVLGDRRGIFTVPRLGGEPKLVVERGPDPFGPLGPTTAYDFAGANDRFAIECFGPRICVGSDPTSVRPVATDSFVTETAELIDLSETVSRILSLDMSADGAWVTFVGTTVDQHVVLGTASADGSTKNILAEADGIDRLAAESFGSPQWSLSGGGVYFSQRSGGSSSILAFPVDTRTGAGRDGPTLVAPALPAEITFGVSTDKQRLVYAGGASRTHLYEVVRGSERIKRLTTGTWTYHSPAICSDGTLLAYAKGNGSDQDIYVQTLDDGDERRLTRARQFVNALSWSPDCTRIAFSAREADSVVTRLVDVDTERVTDLGVGSTNMGQAPQWAADGGALILVRRGQGLVSVDLSSGAESPVEVSQLRSALSPLIARPGAPGLTDTDSIPRTQEGATDSSVPPPSAPGQRRGGRGNVQRQIRVPVISPDGTRFAVFFGTRQEAGLWLLTTDGRAPSKLIDGDAWPLGWTSDGSVLFVRNPFGRSDITRIERVSRDGATIDTIMELPFRCEFGDLAVTREANRVVCALSEATSDVWVIDGFEFPVR